MSKKEVFKRYIVFVLGLLITGIGVAFTKHGDLGVSPISSVGNVMSIQFPSMSLGNWLIVWNCVLIAAQIVILRRNFKLYQLFQIPVSFLFGYFTDFGTWIASFIPVPNYMAQLGMLLVGIIVLALGTSLTVIANVIMNSGEAFVKTVADTIHTEFGYAKVGFDVFCVILAVALSVTFFQGRIAGTREGTIISACLTGLVVKFITKHIQGFVTKMMQQ